MSVVEVAPESDVVVLPGLVAYGVAMSAEILYRNDVRETARLLERVLNMKGEVESFVGSRLPHDQAKNHSAYVEALIVTLRMAHRIGDQALVARSYDRAVAWACAGPLIGVATSPHLDKILKIGKSLKQKKQFWHSVTNFFR